jgi:hypothetical protein
MQYSQTTLDILLAFAVVTTIIMLVTMRMHRQAVCKYRTLLFNVHGVTRRVKERIEMLNKSVTEYREDGHHEEAANCDRKARALEVVHSQLNDVLAKS